MENHRNIKKMYYILNKKISKHIIIYMKKYYTLKHKMGVVKKMENV